MINLISNLLKNKLYRQTTYRSQYINIILTNLYSEWYDSDFKILRLVLFWSQNLPFPLVLNLNFALKNLL